MIIIFQDGAVVCPRLGHPFRSPLTETDPMAPAQPGEEKSSVLLLYDEVGGPKLIVPEKTAEIFPRDLPLGSLSAQSEPQNPAAGASLLDVHFHHPGKRSDSQGCGQLVSLDGV